MAKIVGIDGSVLYDGGQFDVVLKSGKVITEDVDCVKVNDILNKYGKDTVIKIIYTDEVNIKKPEDAREKSVLYSKKLL